MANESKILEILQNRIVKGNKTIYKNPNKGKYFDLLNETNLVRKNIPFKFFILL